MREYLRSLLNSRCPPLLRRIGREERGANMIIFAFGLMVLMGFSSIAVDGGNVYYQQQRMQIAADAASLGGARALADGQGTFGVDVQIRRLATANGADNVTWRYISDGRGVHVDAEHIFDAFFAKLYGYNTFTVNGASEAQYEPVTATDNLFPMTFSCDCIDGGESTFVPETPPTPPPPPPETGCELYPIALSVDNVYANGNPIAIGTELVDIYNGVQAGNFGWLTWDGQNNSPALIEMLTPPGNSTEIYTNPNDPDDHIVSRGDWVQGLPGVTNSSGVRNGLDVLMTQDIIVPVWDQATGQGANSLYHVVDFAMVRITDYRLPGSNRITATFKGLTDCTTSDPPAIMTVNLGDGSNSEYSVDFISHVNDTWTYKVTKISGTDLSWWSLGIPTCDGKLSSPNPGGAFYTDADSEGYKWTLPSGFTEGEFSFALDKEYTAAPVDLILNNGATTAASITGPNCDAPADGSGGTGGNTSLAVCLPPLDFETDDSGGSLVSGQVIDNEWAAWGVHVTTFSPSNHPAMVFDSASPSGGDRDLGTPNQDFGGPGRGDGGGNNQPGVNNQSLGKLLIISEDNDSSDPDDNGGGGEMIFTFDVGVRMDDVYIVDVDDYERSGLVQAYSDLAGNNLLVETRMLGFGDNSVQAVPVNATGVRRLEIEFPGSGGIPAVISCRNQVTELYALGDKVWDDGDGDGLQDENEPGIPDVELELRVAGKSRLVAKTTTNGNGIYRFENLPAAIYEVKIADSNWDNGAALDGAVFTTRNAGADEADSDFYSSTKKSATAVPLNGGDHLDLDAGFIMSSGGGGGGAGPTTVQITLPDNKGSQYEVKWLGKNGNTWNYRVREISGRNLSHWDLGIVNCLDKVSGSFPVGAEIGIDGSTGFNGIKWDVSSSFSEGVFSFTLDDDYAVGTVQALVKAGRKSATQDIAGPNCDLPDGGDGGGDGDDGGGGGDDDSCEFRWLDWDGGSTSNLELKDYMNTTALSGGWRLGDEVEPGPIVSNSSLINSSLTNRVGDEFIIPLSEWNGVGYVVCGFAEVRLLDHDLGANPIRMSVQFLKGMTRSGDTDPNARDYGARDVLIVD